MTAEDYYQQGNAWRKQGDFKRAIDCYLEAIALDPDSPAVEKRLTATRHTVRRKMSLLSEKNRLSGSAAKRC